MVVKVGFENSKKTPETCRFFRCWFWGGQANALIYLMSSSDLSTHDV